MIVIRKEIKYGNPLLIEAIIQNYDGDNELWNTIIKVPQLYEEIEQLYEMEKTSLVQ